MPVSAAERSTEELLGIGVGGAPDGVPERDLGYGDGEKLPEGPGVPQGVGVWDLMTVPEGGADGGIPEYEVGGCGVECPPGRWGDIGGPLMTEGEGVGDWDTGFWEGTMPGKTGVMGVVGPGVVELGVEGLELWGEMVAVVGTLEGFG